LQILVGRTDLILQRVEVAISEDRPPRTSWQVIARARGLPALGFLVRRCRQHRWSLVVGADHAAAEHHRGEPGREGGAPPHRGAAAGGGVGCAFAIRTRVPLVSESDGDTITRSVGCSPETISTVKP